MYDYEKEKNEAIMAGQRALRSLQAAKSELDSARGFGIWDMLGGGLISTWAKHSKMDNAQAYMEQARYDLQIFSKELKDVNMMQPLGLEMDGFLTFADYFFDGFIADWLVQDKINNARQQVDNAIFHVQNILSQLQYSV